MTGTATVSEIDAHWERVVINEPCPLPPAAPRLFTKVEVRFAESDGD